MESYKGNMFKLLGEVDALAITTNGFVKRNGQAVMGRGCAKEATRLFPGIAQALGIAIGELGNIPAFLFNAQNTDIWSFPVKPVSVKVRNECELTDRVVRHMQGQCLRFPWTCPGWAAKADMGLIVASARLLVAAADINKYKTIAIPRPGCGAGELNWDFVKEALERMLDDRFIECTF